MSTNRVPLPWMTVWADNNSTALFIPATPWMEAADAQHARAAWEIRHIGPDLDVRPGYQVADSEDNPGATAPLEGAQSSDGVYYPDDWTDLTSGGATTNNKMLIRFGWIVIKNPNPRPVARLRCRGRRVPGPIAARGTAAGSAGRCAGLPQISIHTRRSSYANR